MFTYLLISESNSNRYYVGVTSDLKARLKEHNAGKVPHTSKYCPWKIAVATWFEDKEKALKFEKYLKTGSGRAFAKKHY